jgi:ABC-type amino acid transport substrate-binding protein
MYTLLIALCLSLGSLPAHLIVGTNTEFQPFSYIEHEKIVGFDIDIATEVCSRLGHTMQLKDLPFDALIPELALGQVHFVAAGMSYTSERAKRVLFTSSYLSGDPLVIVSIGKSVDDLQDKTVIVNEGYTADLYLSAKSGFSLVRLNTVADGFLALKQKRADVFVTAKSTFDAFVQSQKPVDFFATPIEATEQTCAIAISKKYPELLTDIQKALDEMIQDGTLDAIKAKWKLS